MKWDITTMDTWKTEDFPLGAVIPEAGNSKYYVTGGWRSERPVGSEETCTECLLCWIMCPDTSILVEDEKLTGFDLDHCKGCGVSARGVPRNQSRPSAWCTRSACCRGWSRWPSRRRSPPPATPSSPRRCASARPTSSPPTRSRRRRPSSRSSPSSSRRGACTPST